MDYVTQAQLKQHLGLEIKIDKQIFKQRLAKMHEGDFDIVTGGWSPDYNDPLTYGDLLASWNANNHGLFQSEELDNTVRIAQSSLDVQKRLEAFQKIHSIIQSHVPVIPLYERGLMFLRHKELRNVVLRTIGTSPDYRFASLRK